jgi:4'-phosphopantetheinyl transferase EntD
MTPAKVAAMNATDPELQRTIEALAVPGIAVGHRLVSEGDELALLPDELPAFAGSVVKVRRQSGAARIVARQLLSRFGQPPQAILKADRGMPVWPAGIVGSIAHDARVAVAAMAAHRDFLSVGVDIEPAAPIAADVLELIVTPAERGQVHVDPTGGRLFFCIKEAVYKAAYPLDRRFLDHHDVEVDLEARTAHIQGGRQIRFQYHVAVHILALAYVPASGPDR